jgi:2-dehydropantoate 2-reductase
MRWKYRKLLMNLGNAAEAACCRDDPDLPTLNAVLRAEGERCLIAAGIAFALAEERSRRRSGLMTVQPVGGRFREGGSTWQSLQRGGGSVEAEFLNGEVAKLGRRHGVPTPVNDLLLDIVTVMARDRERPGGRSAADLVAQTGAEAD